MRNPRLLVFAALLLCAGAAPAQFPAPGPQGTALRIDPLLRAAAPGAPLHAVLTFEQYPDAAALQALRAAGMRARAYRALPMVAVQGTALQLNSLPDLAGLRAIDLDRPLGARGSIMVAGDGVTAAVIGSGAGAGAGHRDLPYGGKVVQNVKLAPDLFGAGPLVLEGLADADAREALYLLTALEAFDWVLQNRLKHGIRAIHGNFGADGESGDPLGVATRLAQSGGLAVRFNSRER
jgi:serine protease AprX